MLSYKSIFNPVFFLCLVLSLTACVKSDLGEISEPIENPTNTKPTDSTPPGILSISPRSLENFPIDGEVRITFTENLDPLSLDASAFYIDTSPRIDVNIDYEEQTNTVTLTPKENLYYGVEYSIVVTEKIKDIAGNSIEKQFVWSFTTESILDDVPPVTTVSHTAESYSEEIAISLSCSDEMAGCANIFYTLDEEEPTDLSDRYSQPISLPSGISTLKFFSKDKAGNEENVQTYTYTINETSPENDSTSPVTTASHAEGVYSEAIDVSLTCVDEGLGCENIYYSLSEEDSAESFVIYSAPIALSTGDTTLKFYSEDKAGNKESVQAFSYTLNITPPVTDNVSPVTTASQSAGFYNEEIVISLTCSDEKLGCANTYYTIDGEEPTESSTKYVDPIPLVVGTTTLKYFSIDKANNKENVQSFTYKVDLTSPQTSISPAAGSYHLTQFVTLSCSDESTGCGDIYYTTDGSEPTSDSQKYQNPIRIDETTTLQYFAFDLAGNIEQIQTKDFEIDPIELHENTKNIAAGARHTLMLKEDGGITSWGWNDYGQLGNGTDVDRTEPVAGPQLDNVIKLAAGKYHSLALLTNGNLMSWGGNSKGQLGDGTINQNFSPIDVINLAEVVDISAISEHNLALKSNGTVMAWGWNEYGQIGDATNGNKYSPVQVTDLVNMVAIATGDRHSVALKADGTVWAWGNNQVGQLGDGTGADSMVPVQVKGLTDIVSIASGYFHSLALKSNGSVYAWGQNTRGETGNGSTDNQMEPVLVSNLSNVISISAGGYHSFALLNTRTLMSWGRNDSGQLGDSTSTNQLTPVPISSLDSVEAFHAGRYFSVAAQTDGELYFWGYNGFGQFGNGSTNDSSVPVANDQNVFNLPGPKNVTVEASDEKLTISWDPVVGVTEYKVYYSTESLSSLTDLSNVTSLAGGVQTTVIEKSVVLSGLSNGTTYHLIITAIIDSLESARSNEVSAAPFVALPPENIQAQSSDSTLSISWEAVNNASEYTVYYAAESLSGLADLANVTSLEGGTVTTATKIAVELNGLTNSITYYLVVTATVNGVESYASAEVNSTPFYLAPPDGLSAIAGDGEVTLSWNSVADADSYQVYYSTSDNVSSTNYEVVASTSITSVVLDGLTNGTTYYFIVSSTNSFGESNTSMVTPSTPSVPLPVTPTNIIATPGNGSATVSWDMDAVNSSYTIYGSTASGFTVDSAEFIISDIISSPYTVTGLTNQTTYNFIVAAANTDGNISPGSTEISITPVAPSIWTTKKKRIPHSNAVTEVVNDKIHVIGGYNGSYLNTHEVYDPVSDAWVSAAAVPTARRDAVSAIIDGKIHVIGGSSGSRLNTHEVYDPASDAWIFAAAMPTARSDAVSAIIDGKIHVIGGSNGSNLNTHEVYDPVSDSWTSATAMPTSRTGAVSAVIDGKIHVIGGFGSSTHEIYDPVSDSWTSAAALPMARSHAMSAVIGGKIYVIGGRNDSTLDYHSRLEIYDPVSDSWTSGAAKPTASASAVSALIDDKVHVIGGYNGSFLSTHEIYEPISDTWITNVALPITRDYSMSAVTDAKIHVIGGYDGSSYLSAHEIYDPISDAWASAAAMPTARGVAVSAVIDGNIHVIGGYTDTSLSTHEVYDPISDAWTSAAAMPTARWGAVSAVIDGKIHVIGGYSNSALGTHEIYDPVTDAWTSALAMPTARRIAVSAIIDGKIHVIGGYNGSSYLSTHEIYDPVNSAWTSMAAMPTARFGAVSAIIDGRIHVIGGLNNSNLSTHEIYDPISDAWMSTVSMPTARWSAVSANVNDKIHVIGGYNGSYLSTHEIYDPTADKLPSVSLTEGDGQVVLSWEVHTEASEFNIYYATESFENITDYSNYISLSNGSIMQGQTSPLTIDNLANDTQYYFLITAIVNGNETPISTQLKGIPISSIVINTYKTIAAGDDHTTVLKKDGTVWAWGRGYDGQLGDGTNAGRKFPLPVCVDLECSVLLDEVIEIAASYNSTYALKKDGTVWAWGDNSGYGYGEFIDYSKLGDGTRIDRSLPVQVCADENCINYLDNVVSIDTQFSSVAALKNDGTVWTWGWNGNGELGDGSKINRSIPVQVCSDFDCNNHLDNIAAVSTGAGFMVALKSDGTVWSWGSNYDGELGNGTTVNSVVPVQVCEDISCASFLSQVTLIDAGSDFAIALKKDGSVWAWGDNTYGQLADSSNIGSTIPQPVCADANCLSFLDQIKNLSATFSSSIALKNNGELLTWGNNVRGKLGDGSAGVDESKFSPVSVCAEPSCTSNLNSIVEIAGGTFYGTALKEDGTIWAWGENTEGQLGDGTIIDRLTPVQVCSNLNCTEFFNINN